MATESWESAHLLEPEGVVRQSTLSTMARMRKAQGRYAEAVTFLKELVEIRKSYYGSDHPETLAEQNNLGTAYFSQERFQDAAWQFREVWEAAEKELGERHPHTLMARYNLANAQRGLGELEEAEENLRFVLRVREAELKENHRNILTTMGNLGRVVAARGDSIESERLFRDALEGWRSSGVEASRGKATALLNLANLLRDDGRLDDAKPLYERAAAIAEKVYPPWSEKLALFGAQQGRCLALLRAFGDAEALLLPSYADVKAKLGEASPSAQEVLEYVIDLYESWNKPEEAERYRSMRQPARPPTRDKLR